MITLAVATSLLGTVPAVAQTQRPQSLPHTTPVPVTAVVSHYRTPKLLHTADLPKPIWPSGSATITVPAAVAPAHSARTRSANTTANAKADTTATRAGKLPVWLSVVPATTATTTASAQATVSVLPHQAAVTAGVHGVLLTVKPRTESSSRLRVTLDYSDFADAYGGDWASRLHLATMPACILTTPQLRSCRVETPLTTIDSAKNDQLSTVITPSAGASRTRTQAMVSSAQWCWRPTRRPAVEEATSRRPR
ncbi:hypothetical protein GXW82_43250 [Streptacidiphilus sp. 4-A2]|nr:hypothetical protein [Streptacidiphilus sp. 4-A2]